MDTMNTQTLTILGLLVALVVIAAIAYLAWRKRESQRLAQRFGPEYDRTVNELGSRAKAESELLTRQKRVEQFEIVPLLPADAARFTQEWNVLQRRFVDDPSGVVVQADALVRELMQKRGYPMSNIERRVADLSVDHPVVVDNYRAAQVIAERNQRGEAGTEDLRKAVVHYRLLFDDLLEVDEPRKATHPLKDQLETHHDRRVASR